MPKKYLIILNPKAGVKKANRYLADVVGIFNKQGIFTSVVTTDKKGAGKSIAKEYAKQFDALVAIGGDGTFNEVVSGLIEAGVDIPIGYIPAGSTNDFASGIGISKNILEAAKGIVKGNIKRIDVGTFNDRVFTYVASFGAFTETSYQTPQGLKNSLGHLAYVLEGIKDVPSILRSENMTFIANDAEFSGNFIFGAISNSTSLGGLLKINRQYVDISDGKLELLLIRKPTTPIDYAQIIYALNSREYAKCPLICFCSTEKVSISSGRRLKWTLDGEVECAKEINEVKNIPHGIQIFIP